jgi:Domain of unknown function (DUF4347)
MPAREQALAHPPRGRNCSVGAAFSVSGRKYCCKIPVQRGDSGIKSLLLMLSIRIISRNVPLFDSLQANLPADATSLVLGSLDNFGIGIERLAQRLEQAGAPHRAFRLYLAGHGSPGSMALGGGHLRQDTVNLFAPLRRFTAGFPHSVMLWGCNVAAAHLNGGNILQGTLGSVESGWGAGESALRNGQGFQMMLALARVLHAPVQAAYDMQFVQAPWRFVSETVTVHPTGQYVRAPR